jgi:FdhD protein
MNDRVAIAAIKRLGPGTSRPDQDLVAVESPIMIEVQQARRRDPRSLGVLMRTPGDDHDLVLGLLYSEGIIRTVEDVIGIRIRRGDASAENREGWRPGPGQTEDPDDVIEIELADHLDLDPSTIGRAVLATSACGLCGRLAIAGTNILAGHTLAIDRPQLAAATVATLPDRLRSGQTVFAETGGLHAAGLFTATGDLLAIREDVGRHNALDKLVGAALSAGWLPAREAMIAVSGRVAFEIVQKTVMAGVPALIAVGAPSSLAVDAARSANLTLVGFVRDGRFNVYSGVERIAD